MKKCVRLRGELGAGPGHAHVTKSSDVHLSRRSETQQDTSSARFWKRQGADSDSADMLDAALGGGGGGGRGGDPSHWPAASHLPRPQQPHAPSMEEGATRHLTTARCHLTAAARCNATPRNTTPRSHRQRQPPPIEHSTVTAWPRRSKFGSGATLMAQVNSERQNVSTPEAERDGAIGKGRGRSPLATATS